MFPDEKEDLEAWKKQVISSLASVCWAMVLAFFFICLLR